MLSAAFFRLDLLFLDPLADIIHGPVLQVQESHTHTLRAALFPGQGSGPGHLARAADLRFIIRKDEFHRKLLPHLEGTIRGHENAARSEVGATGNEYFIILFPSHFQDHEGGAEGATLLDKSLDSILT